MKHTLGTWRGVTLMTAGAILLLGTGVAQAQRAGRAQNRASGQVAASRATSGQATTNQGSSAQGAGCPQGTSFQTGSTTTQSGSTTTTTTTSAQSSTVSSNTLSSQAIGTVSATRTAANQLHVQWSGNTSNVQRIYIGLLDTNGQVLAQQAISQLPVQASLALTSSARYYGVKVVYSNGTSRTAYSPIP